MDPGHEIAGIVTELGSNVADFSIGDRVGVGYFVDSCGQCEPCPAGEEQFCDAGTVMTYNSRDYGGEVTYGCYSTHIVVNSDYILHIPMSTGPPLKKAR